MIFIYGENNSGKSEYAESIIAKLQYDMQNDLKYYYVATMIPYGEDGEKRVAKHRAMREKLNMITLETPYLDDADKIEDGAVVLLEDLSNLIANRVFNRGTCSELLKELEALDNRVKTLIVISIAGLDSNLYEGETKTYIDILNEYNEKMTNMSEIVIEMKRSEAFYMKGSL